MTRQVKKQIGAKRDMRVKEMNQYPVKLEFIGKGKGGFDIVHAHTKNDRTEAERGPIPASHRREWRIISGKGILQHAW